MSVRGQDWLAPDWRIAGVGALMTTRAGGVSAGRYASMNLGAAVGDDAGRVAANRAALAEAIGAAPVFLRQVHGARVVRVGAADAAAGAPLQEADAAVTTEPGVACVVQAADCLPVLFAAPGGRAVAAAHAGWRGLAAGVVEAAVEAVCVAGQCRPGEVSAWLGACIGPRAFEVGADVLEAFGADAAAPRRARPAASGRRARQVARRPARPGARSARRRRRRARSAAAAGAPSPTPSRFFSFRRDGVTGRMAAAVWIARP